MDSFTTTYATGPIDAPVEELWTLKSQMINCVIAKVATVPDQAPVDDLWTLKSQMINCVIA
jgi:hypothetical protein